MANQDAISLGAWWRRRGRWKWWVIGLVVILGIGAATESHGSGGPSKVSKVMSAMTGQDWNFWERLTTSERTELAQDCRSQLVNRITDSSRADPAKLAAEVSNLYAEYSDSTILTVCEHAIPHVVSAQDTELGYAREQQKERRAAREEKRAEEVKKVIEESIMHHMFVATDVSVREYIKSDLIGEGVKEVTCHAQLKCIIALDDYTPSKAGKIATFLGLARSTQEQLLEDPDKMFATVFADPHMQEATVISWDELETNGGKNVRWPAISVTCVASAAQQIDWEKVSPSGVEELCKVTLLPMARHSNAVIYYS